MRHLFCITILSIVFLGYPFLSHAKTDELLLQDVLMTTISPHLSDAVTGFYGELTQFALFDAEIIQMKRLESGRSFSFEVVVRIMPFEGAHNTIGKDTITMNVDSSGVSITKYVHEKME